MMRQVNCTITGPDGHRLKAGTVVHTELQGDTNENQGVNYAGRIEEDGRLIFRFPQCAPQGTGADLKVWAAGGYWSGRFIYPTDTPFTLKGAEGDWFIGPVMEYNWTIALQRSAQPGGPFRSGLVGLSGRALTDAGGSFLGIGASLFWLAWGFKNDLPKTKANLSSLQGRSDCVRAFAQVGPSGGWDDRMVDPTWPDFDAVIQGSTDLAAEFGQRVQWCVFAGVDRTPDHASQQRLVDTLIRLASSRAEKIIMFQTTNEGQGGLDMVREWTHYLATRVPNLVAVGAPPAGTEARLWVDGTGSNIYTPHLDRNQSGTGGMWRPMRQPWEVQYTTGVPAAWSNDEGIGIASSVAEDADVLRNVMHGVNTWLCRGGLFIVQSGAGIRGGGAADLARGRVANLFDQPTFGPILDGLNIARVLLPTDLPNWQIHNSNNNFPGYPFDTKILADASDREDFLRSYAATSNDGRFVTVPLRILRRVEFKAKRPTVARVYHPLTGQVVDEWNLAPGQSAFLDRGHNGLPDSDGSAAIIVGSLG